MFWWKCGDYVSWSGIWIVLKLNLGDIILFKVNVLILLLLDLVLLGVKCI